MNPQLQGAEAIAGTYPFDLRVSNRALRLNRFFWNMIQAPSRDAFHRDPEQAMAQAGLSEEEKALVRTEDWIGLVRYGGNFFVMEKFARVVKKTNLEVYAMMRGESFEDFMKTRKVPDAR
ncbi:MAG: protocatechuate 3,4-dioxygenase [Pigmentiphaga sp.]|nr:protocatechuate 3,4-dioxygenase [Pigmentiphaga sp.]